MAKLVKSWNDGGSLTVTYEGSGDGSAVFSSDEYEGIDRETSVTFKDASESIIVDRTVRQEGKRQQFRTKDGLVFRCKEGGRFGVLKSEKPYTELEYIESAGTQYIDTGIDFDYNKDTVLSAEAMALSTGRSIIMGSYYGATNRCIAIEFGGTSNSHPGAGRGYVLLKQSKPLDLWSANSEINVKRTISLSFNATSLYTELSFDETKKTGTSTAGTMASKTNIRMFLDARTSNQAVIKYPIRIYKATIKKSGELVRDFIPVLDKDGVACMYDKVSGGFFYNQGTGEFIAGYK